MATKTATTGKPAAFRDAKDVQLACIGLNESDFELDEGTAEKPKREMVLTLLREGPGNARDRRYYEKSCVESIEPLVYARRKLFYDHLGEGQKPGTDSIKNWPATITQTWLTEGADGGMVRKARIKIHDDWLWERAKDPVARKELAVSIEGRGAGRTDDKNGEKYTCIESIIWLNAFKLVPYPGNATMGAEIVEGAAPAADKSTQEDSAMDLKDISLSLIEAERPDLIEALTVKVKAKLDEAQKVKPDALAALREEMRTEFSGKVKELTGVIDKQKTLLEEADRKIDASEIRGKIALKEAYIKTALDAAQLPKEALTERFRARLSAVTEREVNDATGKKTILTVEQQIDAEIKEQKSLVTPTLGGARRAGAAVVKEGGIAATTELTESDKQFLYEKRFIGLHEDIADLDAFRAKIAEGDPNVKPKKKKKVAPADADDEDDDEPDA